MPGLIGVGDTTRSQAYSGAYQAAQTEQERRYQNLQIKAAQKQREGQTAGEGLIFGGSYGPGITKSLGLSTGGTAPILSGSDAQGLAATNTLFSGAPGGLTPAATTAAEGTGTATGTLGVDMTAAGATAAESTAAGTGGAAAGGTAGATAGGEAGSSFSPVGALIGAGIGYLVGRFF